MLWRKELDPHINILDNVGDDRIIALHFKLSPATSIFAVGVYLPASNSSIIEYPKYLNSLEDVLHQLYDKGKNFLLGDFNGHFGKYGGPRSFDT